MGSAARRRPQGMGCGATGDRQRRGGEGWMDRHGDTVRKRRSECRGARMG
jgi:hypothetical protein